MRRTADLPDDIEQLKQLVVAGREALDLANERLRSRDLEIERLKLLLAKLRRLQYGRSSEQLDRQIAQLELTLEELEAQTSAPITAFTSASPNTSSARSSGSSASTGTYAAPAASTARTDTYRSLVPDGTRTPTRSPRPIPALARCRRTCSTRVSSAP